MTITGAGFWKRLGLLVLLGGLSACATLEDGEPFDKQIIRDTELSRTGSNDAVVEHDLGAGTRVRIIGMSGEGNLEIETAAGEKGFVPASSVGDQPNNSTIHDQNNE